MGRHLVSIGGLLGPQHDYYAEENGLRAAARAEEQRLAATLAAAKGLKYQRAGYHRGDEHRLPFSADSQEIPTPFRGLNGGLEHARIVLGSDAALNPYTTITPSNRVFASRNAMGAKMPTTGAESLVWELDAAGNVVPVLREVEGFTQTRLGVRNNPRRGLPDYSYNPQTHDINHELEQYEHSRHMRDMGLGWWGQRLNSLSGLFMRRGSVLRYRFAHLIGAPNAPRDSLRTRIFAPIMPGMGKTQYRQTGGRTLITDDSNNQHKRPDYGWVHGGTGEERQPRTEHRFRPRVTPYP
jgi:hypothetical protein